MGIKGLGYCISNILWSSCACQGKRDEMGYGKDELLPLIMIDASE